MGFPIRKSPDHRLIASSRGLSQLSTSFIATLRQGINTHALSSLTIKSISNTKYSMSFFLRAASPPATDSLPLGSLQILVVSIARQIFDCQRPDFFDRLPAQNGAFALCACCCPKTPKINIPQGMITFDFFGYFYFSPPLLHSHGSEDRKTWWAWIDSNYRPHPYQGCALAT